MLKTLENYLTDEPTANWLLEPLWRQLGHDRRFARIFIASIIGHLIFYAILVRFDLKMEFAEQKARGQGERVEIVEVAPPANKGLLPRSINEPLERADLSQLKYDPNNANDKNLLARSPNPTTARGVETKLPSATQIEKQVERTRNNATSGSGTANTATASPATPAPRPADSPSVQPATAPPTPATAETSSQPATSPPATAPAPQPSEPATKAQPATPAGTPNAGNQQNKAFGTQETEAQYNAYIRAKIKKVNERIYPKELVKDLLGDRVSADFRLVIRRGGEIASLQQLRSTGFSALDNIARQAIYTAKPFDGYPSNAGDTITLTVTVYYAPWR
ncbi:MAG: TonB C-terminal domain-containing protein [Acidobacteriota bacterium]